MITKIALFGTKTYLSMAALAGSVLLAGAVQAGNTFPIAVKVDTAGLDLGREADIRDLYRRIRNAADAVCNNVDRVGLQPVADYTDCYETALGAAVQSVNQAALTRIYLSAHTQKDAAAHGVKASPPAAVAQLRQ